VRRLDPFDRRALAFSIVMHGAFIVLFLATTLRREPTIEFIAYQIDLVSPPPAVAAEEFTPAEEEFVVERPEERPSPEPQARPEPRPEPPPRVEERRPEPTPAPPPPPPEPRPEPVEPRPAAGPNPTTEPEPARTGEGINVRMEGLRRDYPEYYNNIIRQIQRCFRPPAGANAEAVVDFVIQRDGTVRDIRFVTRSGNAVFDFEAMGAVECAGSGRFGALPEDLPDQFPIRFQFRPVGGQQ